MIVGVPAETAEGEARVALVPGSASRLQDVDVVVENGAGAAAGFEDAAYEAEGATVLDDAAELYRRADVVVKLNPPSVEEAQHLKEGAVLISFLHADANAEVLEQLGARGVTVLAMERMPRITRAQSMDALSSQATVAGYKAVLRAADKLPRFFPMLMTAAGTISPARVFVMGAGVAGLQAIATARRLGARVKATDVRPEVREQIESLGADFVDPGTEAAGEGGYAGEQTEDQQERQRQVMADAVADSEVVITTAQVPGRRAPILVTTEMVEGMASGSVIVDVAAEGGGNCELSEPGGTREHQGVTIHAPLNLPASMAPDASRMYSSNVTNYLLHLLDEGTLDLDREDPLVDEPLVLLDGVEPGPKPVPEPDPPQEQEEAEA